MYIYKLCSDRNEVRFGPFETICTPSESSQRDLLHSTLHLDTIQSRHFGVLLDH